MKQPVRDYHTPEGLQEFYKQAVERARKRKMLQQEKNDQEQDETTKTE